MSLHWYQDMEHHFANRWLRWMRREWKRQQRMRDALRRVQ